MANPNQGQPGQGGRDDQQNQQGGQGGQGGQQGGQGGQQQGGGGRNPGQQQQEPGRGGRKAGRTKSANARDCSEGAYLARMTTYFFHLATPGQLIVDDQGIEFPAYNRCEKSLSSLRGTLYHFWRVANSAGMPSRSRTSAAST